MLVSTEMRIARIMLATLLLLFAAAWTYCLIASRNRPMYLWVVGKQPSYGLCFDKFAVCYVIGTLQETKISAAGFTVNADTHRTFYEQWLNRRSVQPRMLLDPGEQATMGIQVDGVLSGKILWIEFHRTTRLVPYIVPSVAIVSATALVLRRIIALCRRERAGRCRNCGYDLRATPNRCPECGTIPATKPSPIP